MKTLTSLFLALALAAPVLAQSSPTASTTPTGEDPLLTQLLDRDRVRNGFSLATDNPRPVYDGFWGNLANANSAGAVATGQDFLRTSGPLLGFTAQFNLQSDVAVISEKKTDTGTHVVFAPAVNQVPYVDAQFAMDFDQAGVLVGVQGRYDAPTGAKMATIDVKAAVKKAIAEIARKFPGIAPSRGGTVEEYLALTDQGAIEHRFNVSLIVGDERRQRRVLIGTGGEVLEEGPDDTGLGGHNHGGAQ